MKEISLSGEWILSDGRVEITGHVPGDITDDFYRSESGKNANTEFYYGDNYKKYSHVTDKNWTYIKEFFAEELCKDSQVAELVFKGIDTFAEVYFNDSFLGKTENMYREYRFDVSSILKKGSNIVRVKMQNINDSIGREEQTKYNSIFHANRIFARKAQCHFGWDWAPDLRGYGIYRDVSLIIRPKTAFDTVQISADPNGTVTARAMLFEKFSGIIRIRISYNGKQVAEETAEITNSRRKLLNLFVRNPLLWWPQGYGEQPVYEYTAEQIVNGEIIDEYRGTFGFRKIEIVRDVYDSESLTWYFKINGKRVFFRGSNWVPMESMTGTVCREKYQKYLQAAKDAHINMLRVWGGGVYEDDCFYEFCDRFGIAVWQDFMFSCSEFPEDDMNFIQNITKEAEYQVRRLRNHPSLIYWCGSNEIRGAFDGREERYSYYTLHYLLRGIVNQLSPEIPYERTTPFAFGAMQNDSCEGDSHNNLSENCLFGASFQGFDNFKYADLSQWSQLKQRIKNYERYISVTENNFSSECAVLGMCNYSSLVRFTPSEELRVDSEFLNNRFLGNPYTNVMPTFFERQKVFAEGMYGPIHDLADFVKKINQSQSDIMKTEIVFGRTNARSGGFLTWMYNDIWPTGTWSVIDYYLSKKPAYYAMKRCFAPLLHEIIRIDDSYWFCYANDTEEDLEIVFKTGICHYNGQVVKNEAYTLEAAHNSCGRLLLPYSENKGDYLFAKGTFGGRRFAVSYDKNRYSEEFVPFEYDSKKIQIDATHWEIRIHANTFVRGFCIDGGKGACIDDNYFDMIAGEDKTVHVNAVAEHTEIRLFTFNDSHCE